jgi:hypothetical protein
MSSRLSEEIAKLAADTRDTRIHDNDTISELTLIVGYGYLIESHPKCWHSLRKHLQAFIELTCARGLRQLYEHSSKIIELVDGDD